MSKFTGEWTWRVGDGKAYICGSDGVVRPVPITFNGVPVEYVDKLDSEDNGPMVLLPIDPAEPCRWINRTSTYVDYPMRLTRRRRLRSCWLEIERRLLPELHARRYSLVRLLERRELTRWQRLHRWIWRWLTA